MSYDLSRDIERIVQDVQRAPSVFNTRPWSVEFRPPDHIELWLRADLGEHDGLARARGRGGVAQVRAAQALEREGMARARAREYVISCGAALFNLRLAIRMAGHDLVVWRLPDPAYADPMHPPTLLASVEIVTGRVKKPTMAEQELYEAIGRRHTNRQPYTIIPVPLAIITAMEGAATREGCHLRLLRRRQAKRWMRLTTEVDSDPEFRPPFRSHVSLENYGPPPKNRYRRTRKDFWAGAEKRFERQPQLMALSTDDDGPVEWLRAGQALQHAILTGTRYCASARYGLAAKHSVPYGHGFPARRHLLKPDELAPYGLSASFLTEPLERDDLEGRPRRWPGRWGYPEVPQMVMRVGYAAIRSHGEGPPPAHMADERSQPRQKPPQGTLPAPDSELRT